MLPGRDTAATRSPRRSRLPATAPAGPAGEPEREEEQILETKNAAPAEGRNTAETGDRRHLDPALPESERLFEMMARSMSVIFWMVSPDWSRVEYVSPAFEVIYGHPVARVYENPDLWITSIHPDDRERAMEFYEKHHGEETDQEYRIVRSDGAVRWIRDVTSPIRDSDGTLLHLSGFAEDVTDRRRAEQALRESEGNFRALAENANDGLFITTAGGRVAYANQRAADLAGTSVERLLQLTLSDLLGPDDRSMIIDRHADRLAGRDVPRQYEASIRRRDGAILPLEITASLTEWQGQPAVLAMVRDISERLRYQDRLRASLAEKEVLLAEVHHRVKNHLQIISALLEIQSEAFELPVHRALFEDLRQRVLSMALIHDRLFLSDDLSRVDAPAFVGSIVEHLRGAYARPDAPVQSRVEVAEITLPVDTAIPCGLLLSELVSNIFKHAFPAADFRGPIASPELRVALSQTSGDRLRLVVSDNGRGLPPGLDWRRAPSLGLQLVDSLARQIDATVTVEGPPGTRYIVDF